MAFGAPTVVDGPQRLAIPYGLFSVLTSREPGDVHWQNGIEWEALTCGPASGIGEPSCTPGAGDVTQATGLPKTFADGTPLGEASAFTVYGSHKCSPVGRPPADMDARARAHLLAREEARVEQAFWSGDLGNTPALAPGSTDLTSGGAVAPIVALAALEDFIADEYGSLGVIHVTRGGLMVLGQGGAIVTNGTTARTLAGTPVVAGAGYPGTSPSGAAPAAGEVWAYASPALVGYRSEVFTSSNRPGDLLDRSVNDFFAVAERTYLIGFDPCGVGAARFTLGCC